MKWLQIEKLTDAIKALLGDGTESKFLFYFTSRFPRLLVHCNNSVEKEARDLLPEYFLQSTDELAATTVNATYHFKLEGPKLIINCRYDTTFPETNLQFDALKIFGISHLFIEQNISINDFLQINGSNVTQLELFYGTLKFGSVNKILQKLPNLKKLKFDDVAYKAPRTSQTIHKITCQNLAESEIIYSKSTNLLQAFLECRAIKKLTVWYPKITVLETLQKYANLEELEIGLNDDYPDNHQHEANLRIHQLKVLKIHLRNHEKNKFQAKLAFIKMQNNLQMFSINSGNSLCQSLSKQLAAHICKLQRLTSLEIFDGNLQREVEAFNAKCTMPNTRLEELTCVLRHVKSLPSSFLGHFINLRKLNIRCDEAEEIIVMNDLISFMNKSQLTSIRLVLLSPECFHLLKKLHVKTLQAIDIHITNYRLDKVPAFDILKEFLPKHPNITDFRIEFVKDYCEPKSFKLIVLIVRVSSNLERLEVMRCPKITQKIINQIAELRTITSWRINGYNSETFYKTEEV